MAKNLFSNVANSFGIGKPREYERSDYATDALDVLERQMYNNDYGELAGSSIPAIYDDNMQRANMVNSLSNNRLFQPVEQLNPAYLNTQNLSLNQLDNFNTNNQNLNRNIDRYNQNLNLLREQAAGDQSVAQQQLIASNQQANAQALAASLSTPGFNPALQAAVNQQNQMSILKMKQQQDALRASEMAAARGQLSQANSQLFNMQNQISQNYMQSADRFNNQANQSFNNQMSEADYLDSVRQNRFNQSLQGYQAGTTLQGIAMHPLDMQQQLGNAAVEDILNWDTAMNQATMAARESELNTRQNFAGTLLSLGMRSKG